MPSPLDTLSPAARSKLRKAPQPEWTAPMLATLTRRHFSSAGWVYERKLDGVRCLAFHDGRAIRLMSRNRKRINDTYPELVEALEAGGRRTSYIADGEIVAFEGNRTSFARLQGRLGITDPRRARRTGIAVHLYLFDLLHLDGHDTTRLPLRDRKGVLRKAITFRDPLRFTAHRNERGAEFLEDACRKGWEGLIAKRADAAYQHKRSGDWLKFKCDRRQEFIVVGYTDPKGSRIGFGALLLGYYDDDRLAYAGKVGTGYDDRTLRQLGDRLNRMRLKRPPFHKAPKVADAHWTEPKLVAEIAFTEWTTDGRLRHPRYLGLRTDKSPEEVVREND